MNHNDSIWAILGLEPTNDEAAIRRAYRAKLRVTNPEDDAAAFQRLREAFELAQRLARYEAAGQDDDVSVPARDAVDDDQARPVQTVEPLAVSHAPEAPAPRPVDAETREVLSALDALTRELQAEGELNAVTTTAHLDRLLTSSNLERFDLVELLDERLSELLARTCPRSDPLLPAVVASLQWGDRRNDASLPPVAFQVLARHDYLTWQHRLETGKTEECKAWRRLAGAEQPLERWSQAFLFHQTRWPELDLLQSLDQHQPALIEQLNPANVEWWRRFAQRPRFTVMTFAIGLMISMLAAMFLSNEETRAGDQLAWLRMMIPLLGGFVMLELIRIYLIEWPIILTRRWWPEEPPRWFIRGWVADCLMLPLLALWSRQISWLAWTFAVFALLTAVWAAVVAGPMGKAAERDSPDAVANRSRILRVLLRNIAIGVWLALMLAGFPDTFELPLVVAASASLAASALARDEMSQGFLADLTPGQQRLAAWGASLVILAVMAMVVNAGAAAEWQPAILTGTVISVLLRRCFVPTVSVERGASFVILVWLIMMVLLFARVLMAGSMDAVEAAFSGPWQLWVAALLLQSWALVAILRFQWTTR